MLSELVRQLLGGYQLLGASFPIQMLFSVSLPLISETNVNMIRIWKGGEKSKHFGSLRSR